MKNLVLLVFASVIILISSCSEESNNPVVVNEKVIIDKTEAQTAFVYLNAIRINPNAYSTEIGDDLSYVTPIHTLAWNVILASVAENKAKDMAARNYFDHVDPDGNGLNILIDRAGYKLIPDFIKDKSQNYFESIAAGYDIYGNKTGKEFIKMLILDDGLAKEQKGHRKHLLGIDAFWQNCYDIGIGIARDPQTEYKNYCCIIIAKKQY
jgi:uncharacterized protein YkwD